MARRKHKLARLEPDEYIARYHPDASTRTVIPIGYRPRNEMTYTVNYKHDIMRAVQTTGSLELAAYTIKAVCDERKQQYPKSRRECNLQDLKKVRQNPKRFHFAVYGNIDPPAARAPIATQDDNGAAVVANASMAVNDAEKDEGAALNDDTLDDGATTATNTTNTVTALESSGSTASHPAPALTEGPSDGGTSLTASTTIADPADDTAPPANSSRKRSKAPPSQQSEGPAQHVPSTNHRDAARVLAIAHTLHAAAAGVLEPSGRLSARSMRAFQMALLSALRRAHRGR
ncbi:unnamed protein product [Zymoseptoria tritici ST99CH_1A5]|uniref:Uncharacterized protein n=2 Tax=Zymoseptoria tritici TaxID=1047171 RepID=A0A2H1FNI3_ZYMTR|nr:unnamed protein product [Zymoseptoria tritici ST99CH_1E4]SMR45051.1 unnamed protein product [Zymoseptoria tritici ST99CH_3D1]SMY20216.1 unnamed protein product [Zymoseptoria tritici ST99CH_1A5]